MAFLAPSTFCRWWFVVFVALASVHARAAPAFRRSDSYQRVEPALVKLYKTDSKNEESTASGFIIDEAGHVLTNYHVVRDALVLHVGHIKYGQMYYSTGIDYMDPERDIAIVHVEGFRGFVYQKDSRVDATARPIDLHTGKPIRNSSEAFDLQVSVLSNPREHTDIYSPGNITGFKDIGELLAPLTYPKPPPRAGYKIIVLTNTVAPGSSGGLVVDETNGNPVGMIFGADRHEHLAFALPVQALQAAMKQAQLAPTPHSARYALRTVRAAQDGRDTDEYYKSYLYQRGTRDEEQGTETLDGYLVTVNRGKIPGGRVWAVGQTRGCHEKLSSKAPLATPHECRFSQVATTQVNLQDGSFKLEVPIDTSLEWMVHAEHRAFEMKQPEGPFANHGFRKYYTLTWKPAFYRQSVILYADQRVIALKWDRAEVNLNSTSEPIAWRMQSPNAPWLQADSQEGWTRRNPRPVRLQYLLARARSLDPRTRTTLVFSTSAQEIAEVIDVYAGDIPEDEYIYFDGVVNVDGLPAAPYENVFVTAHVGERQISKPLRIEDSGRFLLRLRREDVTDTVVLRVSGAAFEDANEAGLTVSPPRPGDTGELIHLKVRLKGDPGPVTPQ